MVIGIAATSVSSVELDVRMAPGESVMLGGYVARFEGVRIVAGPNYTAERGEILVTRNEEFVVRLFPEKRRYHASQQVMITPSMLVSSRSLCGAGRATQPGLGRFVCRKNRWFDGFG